MQSDYSYLGTILTTSVDYERCFSTAPYVGYKIRSDGMLDEFRNICFESRNIPEFLDRDYELPNPGFFKHQSRLASLVPTI